MFWISNKLICAEAGLGDTNCLHNKFLKQVFNKVGDWYITFFMLNFFSQQRPSAGVCKISSSALVTSKPKCKRDLLTINLHCMRLIVWLRNFSLSWKLTFVFLFFVVLLSAAFSQDSYEVNENDGFVEVCVVLQSLPDDLGMEIVIDLTSTDGINNVLFCIHNSIL